MGAWSGVIAFVVTIVGSVLLSWLILQRSLKSTSGNKAYDRLVMHSIQPKGQGIPIDFVAETLGNFDVKEFHLAGTSQK